ncbi:MAG TPA: NAD(P)-dependent oxidoreductase [Gaiellaceae bacterium]|nr:NAD(P)-dependent oxidoreductase [Gaiellaceae bacterium]
MRVLVTGGRGFIGAHVCAALEADGHQAVPLGRADGDLAVAGVAERLVEAHAPDAVVHLAATMPGDERLAENAPIAQLVAAACRAREIRLFHGSTTSVYADDTPYAESKRASEEAAGDATILRFHFPYGPGQRRGAIPGMLAQARAGEPVVVYRGWARSFCFVADAARAVALLVGRGERGAWDVGRADDRRSLEEVALLCVAAVGADPSLLRVEDPPAGPAPVLDDLDTGRLRSLGWRPEVALEDGIRLTAAAIERPWGGAASIGPA